VPDGSRCRHLVGPWSRWLARRVPRVEAFESNASIYGELQHILLANVVLHNIALSDRRERSQLRSPSDQLGTKGRSTLMADGHGDWIHQDVELAPLDGFGFTDVGFVKIDVEATNSRCSAARPCC
jgi:FkbM family methyltransferase